MYHSEEWDGSGGVIVDGHEVDEEGSAADERREEGSSTHHLTDPVLTCTETTQHNDSIRRRIDRKHSSKRRRIDRGRCAQDN